jgi:cell division septation protein DedD
MSYRFEGELLGDRRELEEPPRRLVTVAAAAAVMALFAGGLWFAYWQGTRHAGNPAAREGPLIRADLRPMMVKPAAPGGLRISDRNLLIYNPNQPMVEHLLPPPEQPMTRPGAAAAAPPPTAAAAVPPPTVAAVVAKPSELPHAAPEAPGGDVRLQLGSVRSAEAARREWDRIRRRNADVLGALSASPVKVDLGDKGVYWRIETGPLGGSAADRLCAALKRRNYRCLVVR